MQQLMWALGAATLTGLLLGFFFRLPALVAASVILATIACVTSIWAGSSAISAALLTVTHLLVLQGSYLAGLIISAWASELRKRYRVRRLNRSTARTGSLEDDGAGLVLQRASSAHHHRH
jgi:hypothetical protein